MNDIKIASPSVDEMATNILRLYSNANTEQRFQGETWYDVARTYCVGLSSRYGVTLDVAACVLAVYSQNQSWKGNMTLTEAHLAGAPRGLKRAIAMSQAVLDNPHDPFTYVVGPKINPFARCVAGDLTAVATDRWAQRAAFDTVDDKLMRNLIQRKGVRDDMIAAYTKAAASVGIPPAVMQAIVWVVIRGYHD